MPPSIDALSLSATPSVPGNSVDTSPQESLNLAHAAQTKRNRTQLSCTQCRHAKLKCDRAKPCSQCVKKGRQSLCIFPLPAKRMKPAVSMHNRLKHLESLVKGAMTGQPREFHDDIFAQTDRSSQADTNASQQDFTQEKARFDKPVESAYKNVADSNTSGQIFLGPNESTYVGATHWAAILDDIEEVKSYFNENDTEDESVRPDTSLIFNSQTLATKKDLLIALPERAIVDRLIYRYFNSNSPALHIIHKPTFQQDYKKFWTDPKATPISWLGLLYSLMCLATFVAYGAGEEVPDTRGTPMEMLRTYRGCCAQCLILSNYIQPGPYTLETLLIYMEGEFVLSKDDQMNCYVMVGVAVRLALRMGLHRDPDNVAGNISACQGELRRRIWGLLYQIDLLVSFHIGLPSMVQSLDSDTKPPRNFRDEDFDEHTIDLPPSRPESEITPMSYTIAKGRLCQAFSKVAEQANRLSLPSYDEVMSVDKIAIQSFARVPTFLRVIPMELSITDSPQLIIQRISIHLLFHKTRCVLHRKYITKSGGTDDYSYSRKTALDSAIELLHLQSEVHNAVQPGGVLSKDLWIVSSLSMHDFLLAAMIAYVMFMQVNDHTAPYITLGRPQEEVAQILERSLRVWTETRSMSVDARKAYEVLGIMVKKVKSALGQDDNAGAVISLTSTDRLPSVGGSDGTVSMSKLLLNDMISTGSGSDIPASLQPTMPPLLSTDPVPTATGLGLEFDFDSTPMPMESLGAMIDLPTSLDWDIFDNQLRAQQLPGDSWPEISFEGLDFGSNYDHDI